MLIKRKPRATLKQKPVIDLPVQHRDILSFYLIFQHVSRDN